MDQQGSFECIPFPNPKRPILTSREGGKTTCAASGRSELIALKLYNHSHRHRSPSLLFFTHLYINIKAQVSGLVTDE